jgi:branched-chain amino acid transport system ATP-binding protein
LESLSLQVRSLSVKYGAVSAVRGVSLTVPEGKTVSILGANGAGKTGILRAIIGLTPSTGSILFYTKEINGMSVHHRSLLGIQLVPEGRRVFSGLSVEANLLAGAYNFRSDKNGVAREAQRVLEIFPVLKDRLKQTGGTLSGGEQQMLAIARGLMARPKLLMMDEPTMGLAPIIVEILSDALEEIRKSGVNTLLVEQNARLALDISDYSYFLQLGEIVMEGPSADVKEDPRIRKIYVGI